MLVVVKVECAIGKLQFQNKFLFEKIFPSL